MKYITTFLMLLTLLLTGCSSDKTYSLFTTFEEKLMTQDYKGLYTLLSSESQQSMTEDEFINRYSTIYSGIGANNIELEMFEIDKETETIPFSLKMETVAGELNASDFTLPYVKEDGELKIIWSESLIFPGMQRGDKIRVTTESATRGSIFDHAGEVLASDGILKSVGIHPAIFDQSNREEKIKNMATLLDISEEVIIKKLEANSNPDYFVPIVDILPDSPKLQLLVNRNSEGILVQDKKGRIYKNHEAFGRLIGYIGSITAEELAKDKEMIYKSTSKIGKAGLEQVYESTLRGIDGSKIYIERDGINIKTLATKEVQHGQNITLSIDSNLQINVYEKMKGEKGSATAINPKTGEILALVSSPSYNSNSFSTYMTLSEKQHRETIDYADEENRFSKLYSPGSTFKLITATTGLEQGTINPTEFKTITNKEWQPNSSWGNYNVRRINEQTQVSLREAIKYSDNIYFAMSAIEMGSETLINGAKQFGIGTSFNVGYPLKQSQISNSGLLDREILLADTGYGQGEIMVTTLNMALAYSALSNNGTIMNPILILDEAHPINIFNKAFISEQNLSILQDAFSAVINETDGTGHQSQIEGIKLAGKTGTAEIKSKQGETGSQNGWFVATDLDEATISLAIVIEDVQNGLGTLGVVSMVKEMLTDYLK